MKTYTPIQIPTMAEAISVSVLSDRIAFVRQARGLSMREVARRLDVSPSQVCGWEQGNHRPGLDVFFLLAGVLDVDPVDLYEGTAP